MIQRSIQPIIKRYSDNKKIIIISGARQVGKTTLTEILISMHKESAIRFNGDEPDVRELLHEINSVQIRNYIGKYNIVFIDEAQKIPNIGNTLKLIHDNLDHIQVYVTGSSSFELASTVQEALTGRKLEFSLFPISFSELVSHTNLLEEKRMLEHRLLYGSYPEIVNNIGQEKRLLKTLVLSYLFKDIFTFERVKKPDIITKLTKSLALQVGSEVSYSELSRILGIDKKTVEIYIDILEKAFIVFKLPSLSRNVRNEIKKGKKIYFWDNGVRNAIIGNFMPMINRNDIGQLWENYLVSERLKKNIYNDADYTSYFWRTTQQQEVDYIEDTLEGLLCYEFKWNKKAKPRLSQTISKAYDIKKFEIIHPGNYEGFLME